VLSWFAHDPDEFWAVTGDTAGPLASLLADLSAAERAQVKREVTEGIAKFRAGDVYRIPRRPSSRGAGVGSRAAALQRTWRDYPRPGGSDSSPGRRYRCSVRGCDPARAQREITMFEVLVR